MAVYKAVDSEKLDEGLTAIANSIRAKSGTAESLTFPEGFKGAIDSLKVSGGEIGKPYIDTSKVTHFNYFFYEGARLNQLLNLIDTSSGKYFNKMFYYCSTLETIPQLDTSKGIQFNYMFQNCKKLTSVPQLDTSSGTHFNNMFDGCSKLTSIPQLDISNCSSQNSSMFSGCTSLETVSLTTAKSNLSSNTFQNCTALKNITIGEDWNVNIYLHYSEQLTVESLHGMIENLADLTGKSAKTFQVGATNLAKIDEEHITMLQQKNWNYS